MANKKKKAEKKVERSKQQGSTAVAWLCREDAYTTLCGSGYTRLSENPEIMTAVSRIADLVSSMTIYLMENTENGDVRIKNGLSKRVDIAPNSYMSRKTLIYTIVRTMLLEGDGNAVVLVKSSGEEGESFIESLTPVPPGGFSLIPKTWPEFGYTVDIYGKAYEPSELLHFVCNPDPYYPWRGTGYRAVLKDVAANLKQAADTERGFLKSDYKPSLIILTDSTSQEIADMGGRQRFIKEYLEVGEPGAPWIIPADMLKVEQVKPLSLTDLALADGVKLNKQTVAAILGIPPYMVGAGTYNKDEWNNFINAVIMPIAQIIQQELSRKLLVSPNLYFKLNARSLYAYNMEELARVGDDQYVRGIMTGNEVRDWLNLDPKEGLDDLVILENYIPRGMIGDQKKLMKNDLIETEGDSSG